jgi:hypothetical protein
MVNVTFGPGPDMMIARYASEPRDLSHGHPASGMSLFVMHHCVSAPDSPNGSVALKMSLDPQQPVDVRSGIVIGNAQNISCCMIERRVERIDHTWRIHCNHAEMVHSLESIQNLSRRAVIGSPHNENLVRKARLSVERVKTACKIRGALIGRNQDAYTPGCRIDC